MLSQTEEMKDRWIYEKMLVFSSLSYQSLLKTMTFCSAYRISWYSLVWMHQLVHDFDFGRNSRRIDHQDRQGTLWWCDQPATGY